MSERRARQAKAPGATMHGRPGPVGRLGVSPGEGVISSTSGPAGAASVAAEDRWLFIYYRVASVDAVAAGPAVQHLQSRLCRTWPGLQAQWFRRPEEKDGMQTWMEIYARPGGITAEVQAHIEEEARVLAPWCRGPRHVEVFVPCAS